MWDIDRFRENLQVLISKFEKDKNHYLSKGYPEAQVRVDFLNSLFKSLGWDLTEKPLHDWIRSKKLILDKVYKTKVDYKEEVLDYLETL